MTKQSALATGVCLLAAALGLMAPVAFARPQETENERISRIGMAFQSATADEMAAVMAHGAMAEFIAPADIVMACGEVAAAQALVPQFDARIAATRARLIEGGDRAEDIDRYLANSLNLSTMTEAVHVRLCAPGANVPSAAAAEKAALLKGFPGPRAPHEALLLADFVEDVALSVRAGRACVAEAVSDLVHVRAAECGGGCQGMMMH